MSTEYFRRRERCEHDGCSERNFYVGGDGFIYCRRGHQQSDQGTVIAEDTGELVQAGKKHKRTESEAPSISSAGSSAGQSPIEVLLLCLQLILRKQVQWLINKGLPADFEQLVKDLWTIQIRQLDPSTSTGPDSEDERSQLFSSQTDSEFEDSRSRSTSRRRRSEPQLLGQMDLLAILYIAALILRAPITVGDIYTWISTGDLPYYQSSHQVPEGLRRQLPGHLQRLLDPETWMKPHSLHVAIHKKLAFYRESHGLQIPGININVALLRWTKALALPLEVYVGTSRIMDLLGLDISWTAAGSTWTSTVPEVLLMGAIVVSTKLLFPLDGRLSEAGARDLAALNMDWSAWSATMPDQLRSDSFEKAFKAKQNDFLSMDDNELDQYLDWYTKNMASKHPSEHGRAEQRADFNRDLMALFPVDAAIRGDLPDLEKDVTERLRRTQSKLLFEDTATGSYQHYLSIEDLAGEGQEPIKHLYELAAELCATDLKRLVRIVCLIEKHLKQVDIDSEDEQG